VYTLLGGQYFTKSQNLHKTLCKPFTDICVTAIELLSASFYTLDYYPLFQ